MRKKILGKDNGFKRFFLLCLYVLLVMIAWVMSISYINKHLRKQILTYLDDLGIKKAAWIDNKIGSNIELLETIADKIAELDNSDRTINFEDITTLKEWIGVYQLAFIDVDGLAYTSEGMIKDVSNEPFFQIPMDGVPYISGVIEYSNSIEGLTTYGVPIISPKGDKGSIIGVLVADDRTQDFIQNFKPISFKEQGYTYLIDVDGNVIEGTLHSEEYAIDNIFDELRKGKGYSNTLKKLEEAIYNKEEINFFYENSATNEIMYTIAVPLKLNNWSMMMVFPEKSIYELINNKSTRIHILFSIVFALSILLMLYSIYTDIKAHTHMKKNAYIDRNTGLFNKNYLRDHISEKIFEARGKNTALVIYNIQRFKVLNELYGTDIGNKILKEIAHIFENSKVYKNEIVINGYADEFAILYYYESKSELEKRIKDNLDYVKDVIYDKYNIIIEIAVGIYEIQDSKYPFENIYTLTCMATNKNKESVAELFTYYSKDLVQGELERKKLEDSIREGIEKKEFRAWFQPQFDTTTKTITGCESLARWHRSDGTVLTPYYFIEASERSALICDIDKLILEDVCKNIKEWRDKGLLCVPVSVNLSRAHLQNAQIVKELKELTDKYNIPTQFIQLEITESVMIENEKVLKEVIEALHEMGFKVLLDDFGVGYSSLMTINSLNFDVLKIDKSFVDALESENGKHIIEYTINLGRQLGMDIIVEGVETKKQVKYFSQMNKVSLQGYYFSRPVDRMAIQSFIQ